MSLSAEYLREIEIGLAAAKRRRSEDAFARNGSRLSRQERPEPVQIAPPEEVPIEAPNCVYHPQLDPKFPERVAFFALMGVHAARRYSEIGGGWRLHVLAKALDPEGRGSVRRDELREYALSLGVIPRTYRRWYRRGHDAGLFEEVQRESGEWWLILPSHGKAAYRMGADDVGVRVEIDAADLVGSGWKANVWAAYEATRDEQVTRATLRKRTDVSESTQRYRDNQAGVERERHFAQSNYRADSLAMLQDVSDHRGVFLANNGRLYWRLPDSRTTDRAVYVGKGRGRKAKGELRHYQETNGLLKMQQALSDFQDSVRVRLFCRTSKQRAESERKVDRLNLDIRDLYQHVYQSGSGSSIWDVYEQDNGHLLRL